METYGLHQYPGKLFIVEGVDGSGKSTQIALLRQWLISEGYTVFFSEWNSSPLVKKTTSKGKKKQLLTPTTFSLIHATDFADRTEHDIIPPLKAGAIVLADRYIYTAFARDAARGVDRLWLRELYQFAVKPTVAFYYRVPLDVSLKRILTSRNELKYYEAGMDMGLSNDPYESFKLFQQRIVNEYETMVDEFGLTAMDATLPIPEQQRQMRRLVRPHLQGVRRLRASAQNIALSGLIQETHLFNNLAHELKGAER
ncbi:thymidylate kinase [Ktedonosporobacter rubrisoli]|uniref:Thymidylate kinase n=1 Tax=Ktedonosporobacter rubrisoli TaxID=2509675 RepID=A0A4P6JX67_KTERU|nr:thymidylate kinase [Ktedonosporobacter rubrisoli]QBD80337.1 thymidylate kinase [Ktedonosporobacter rubrisoli]